MSLQAELYIPVIPIKDLPQINLPHGFNPGHTSSMYRVPGSVFAWARLEFHARISRYPSMSISSMSRMRQPASSRALYVEKMKSCSERGSSTLPLPS